MRTRSGIVLRFLFLAALMLGVVAMHQLPMAHGSHRDHRAPAAQPSPAEHRAATGHQSGQDRHDAPEAVSAEQAKPQVEADHGTDHSMLHLCLAILAAGFLLLALWWLGTRWPGATTPFPNTSWTRVRARPPPWTQPCVFRLRVLRL